MDKKQQKVLFINKDVLRRLNIDPKEVVKNIENTDVKNIYPTHITILKILKMTRSS